MPRAPRDPGPEKKTKTPSPGVRETRIQMPASPHSVRLWGGHWTAQNLSFVLGQMQTIIISTPRGAYEDQMRKSPLQSTSHMESTQQVINLVFIEYYRGQDLS